LEQLPLQQSVEVLQEAPFGRPEQVVVVEVVLVEVLVEVVGVVVDVEVVLVGVVVEVLVEVVLVEVEVVLVEVVLVEVVLVEKHVRGLGSRQSSVPPHPPQQSQGCPAWLAACCGLTQRVSASPRRQVPSALRGTWQILTVPGGQGIAAIALVEGIMAARAVPAKSLSARRRLIEPSARARARSSKERLVDSWLTCAPLCTKGGTLGD
jgi:hypothetical protein